MLEHCQRCGAWALSALPVLASSVSAVRLGDYAVTRCGKKTGFTDAVSSYSIGEYQSFGLAQTLSSYSIESHRHERCSDDGNLSPSFRFLSGGM